jgi:fused signal recognition particle receptor
MGLFERIKTRLGRTRSALSDGIGALFRGGRPMDAALLGELEALLYAADLGPLASELIADLESRHRRGEIRGETDVRASLRSSLLERLARPADEFSPTRRPTVVLVVGVNGSGKTTTIAKLAHRFAARGHTVLVGACDTYRAAAADQLAIWADRSRVQIVRKEEGADPAAVAFEALEAASVLDYEIVLLDTAGRLHVHKQLMDELKKIQRVAARRIEGAPHEVWLVLDATTGQNALTQARVFTEVVKVTGVIVAKLDGTARAGALFRIQRELGLPVLYVGTGEGKEDFERFEPESFVDAILAG